MSNPERDIGLREKRLAAIAPRLSEALKCSSSMLVIASDMCDVLKKEGSAKAIRAAIHEFDLLTLEADRI